GFWIALADPTKLHTGLTGTVRSHRRRGIATALKVAAIDLAKKRGVATIETDNEENNPMYALNVELGFEPQPAWLDFTKRLRGTEAAEGDGVGVMTDNGGL
ncbi:GNAT family N-acetyltransferase, partial [bacterium]|nr:GNAT family N-acetyltransferase [bacterium]